MPFQIIRNDITKVRADAIVNTANPEPICAGGTDYAIYAAAGREALLEERKKIGKIPRGEARETPAFALNAKYIIHTVGPQWVDGNHGEYDTLRACYNNALHLAIQLRCRSIAFPLIATGVYGFPKDKALQVAMNVIQSFLMEYNIKVILVVFDDRSFQLSGQVIEDIREYVDSNYVHEANQREYRINRRELEEQEEIHVRGDYNQNRSRSFAAADTAEKVNIEELIASPEKTFQEKLFEIIDERGLTGPQVYKNYISKQVYSKIQADKYYHPNKYTAIALCLSLHLDVHQTQDLIGRAGWTLSSSNKADLIVKACILNQTFNIVDIDLILFDYKCPTLDKIK